MTLEIVIFYHASEFDVHNDPLIDTDPEVVLSPFDGFTHLSEFNDLI